MDLRGFPIGQEGDLWKILTGAAEGRRRQRMRHQWEQYAPTVGGFSFQTKGGDGSAVHPYARLPGRWGVMRLTHHSLRSKSTAPPHPAFEGR